MKKCVRFNILPPTAVIKAKHNVRFSNTASNTFQANLQNVSFENLKLGIVEEKKNLELCKKHVRELKISLHGLITQPSLHVFLEDR